MGVSVGVSVERIGVAVIRDDVFEGIGVSVITGRAGDVEHAERRKRKRKEERGSSFFCMSTFLGNENYLFSYFT